jgi:hypothetical protein
MAAELQQLGFGRQESVEYFSNSPMTPGLPPGRDVPRRRPAAQTATRSGNSSQR